MSLKISSKPFIVAAAAGALALGVGGYVWKEESRPHVLEMYIFSLSSGRSIFIRTPGDVRILIDGGSNSEIIRRITEILPFYSRRIDYIVATNTESKNVTGLIDVLNRYEAGQAFVPGLTLNALRISTSTDQVYDTFLETLEVKNLKRSELMKGDEIAIEEKIRFTVLFPADSGSFSYSKASAPELLWSIQYGSTAAVFLGNASPKIQKTIASSTAPNLNSTALIALQNPSSQNLSANLINILKPEYLIYSKNPNQSSGSRGKSKNKKDFTLSDYQSFNIKEGRTIKIISDGSELVVEQI